MCRDCFIICRGSLSEAIAQLNLLADIRQSPLVALMNTLAWQGQTGAKGETLADSLVESAKKLAGRQKNARQFIQQAQGPKGPLDGVFGPLTGLMAAEGKEHGGHGVTTKRIRPPFLIVTPQIPLLTKKSVQRKALVPKP